MAHRFRSAVVFAALLPACLINDGFNFPDPAPPQPPPPRPPRPECAEPLGCDIGIIEFDDESVTHGIGLALDLPVNLVTLAGYEFASTDPAIADVEVDGNGIHLHSFAPGSATIEARRIGSPVVVDSVDIAARVVDRADVLIRSSAVSPASLATMAALPGEDTIGIIYRSASDERLSGRGSLATTGPVTVQPTQLSLLSEIFEHRDRYRLGFTSPGTGTLEIGLGDERVQSFPIEVLLPSAAMTLELVPLVLRNNTVVVAPDPLIAGEIMGVDLVAHAPDGRFIAAVPADWTAPVPTQSQVIEIVFSAPITAGAFEVTATTAAGRTVTRTINAR